MFYHSSCEYRPVSAEHRANPSVCGGGGGSLTGQSDKPVVVATQENVVFRCWFFIQMNKSVLCTDQPQKYPAQNLL